jgi:hypothetical protein
MRTDGRTDMTKLIDGFGDYADAPKEGYELYYKFVYFGRDSNVGFSEHRS